MTAHITHTDRDTFASTHHLSSPAVRDTFGLLRAVAWLALLHTISTGTTFKPLTARLHTATVYHCPWRLTVRDTGPGLRDLACRTGRPTYEGACCVDTLAAYVTGIRIPTLVHILAGVPVIAQLQAIGTGAVGLALEADAGVRAATVILAAEVLWLAAVPVSR